MSEKGKQKIKKSQLRAREYEDETFVSIALTKVLGLRRQTVSDVNTTEDLPDKKCTGVYVWSGIVDTEDEVTLKRIRNVNQCYNVQCESGPQKLDED